MSHSANGGIFSESTVGIVLLEKDYNRSTHLLAGRRKQEESTIGRCLTRHEEFRESSSHGENKGMQSPGEY